MQDCENTKQYCKDGFAVQASLDLLSSWPHGNTAPHRMKIRQSSDSYAGPMPTLPSETLGVAGALDYAFLRDQESNKLPGAVVTDGAESCCLQNAARYCLPDRGDVFRSELAGIPSFPRKRESRIYESSHHAKA
jgi:hypothetical protein